METRQPEALEERIAQAVAVVDEVGTVALFGSRSYLDIDHGRSYDSIESDLGDLEDFARAVAKLLPDARVEPSR